MILYDVYIVQNVWQVLRMWCVWQMSISMYLRHCVYVYVYVDVYEMRMRCGEQTKWSLVFNIGSAYIHLQYVKLCEINIRTRMNEGTTDRPTGPSAVHNFWCISSKIWCLEKWLGWFHAFSTTASRKIAGKHKMERAERGEKNYIERENVLKNVKGRNGLHACTHMTISRQTLLFLLPLLIFIAFCLFVFGSLSCSLARMQFVRVCMRPFDAVRLLQRC